MRELFILLVVSLIVSAMLMFVGVLTNVLLRGTPREAVGAVLSNTTVMFSEALILPRVSLANAARVYTPSVNPLVLSDEVQKLLPEFAAGNVARVAPDALMTLKETVLTEVKASITVVLMLLVPERFAPIAGELKAITGAALSTSSVRNKVLCTLPA